MNAMGSWVRSHSIKVSVLFSILGFLVVSFLPVWLNWQVFDRERVAVADSFWTMVHSVPAMVREVGFSEAMSTYYGSEWFKLVAVFLLCGAVGRLMVSLLRWAKKKEDS
jgi:hypothetical protein